jgi:uncharacterized protein (TIGR04255 family)
VPAIETTEYFEYYPRLPQSLKQEHGPFAMRVLHAFEGGTDLMSVHMGHTKSNGGEALGIALDLDYFLAEPGKVELDKGMEWVSRAHQNVEIVFEACITDKTRELFEEIKQ